MKAAFRFDLTDQYEKEAYKVMSQADSMYWALQDILELLARSRDGLDNPIIHSIADGAFEIIEEHGVKLDIYS
jgi:hypothetical protein